MKIGVLQGKQKQVRRGGATALGRSRKSPHAFRRSEAVTVAENLSSSATTILIRVFIQKQPLHRLSKRGLKELLAKGLLRFDKDLISGKDVYVLEKQGRWVCDVLQGKPTPKPRKTKAEKIHSQLVVAGEVPAGQSGISADEIKRLVRVSQDVLDALTCPNCGGSKRQGFTVDQKCWYALPEALRHPLMKRSVETQQEFMLRHPAALLAALEYLKTIPSPAEIRKQARTIEADVPYHPPGGAA